MTRSMLRVSSGETPWNFTPNPGGRLCTGCCWRGFTHTTVPSSDSSRSLSDALAQPRHLVVGDVDAEGVDVDEEGARHNTVVEGEGAASHEGDA
jgi:hypothetical protein